MATEDQGQMDVAVLQRTQDILGSIIKKPPLTDKLLRKPPFKFLHDIITNVINATGFMSNVFTAEELNGDNIKDRDSKVAFLQKAIDYVANVTGVSLTMRPSKTVAGHEPERTNEFLQVMGRAAFKEKEQPEEQEKAHGKSSSTTVDNKSVAKRSDREKRQKTLEESEGASVGKEIRGKKSKSDDKKTEKSKAKQRTSETAAREAVAPEASTSSSSREKTRNGRDGKEGRVDRTKKRSTSRDNPGDGSSRRKAAATAAAVEARSERRRSSVNEADANVRDRRPSIATKSRSNDVKKKTIDKVAVKKVANEDDADQAIAEVNKDVQRDVVQEKTKESMMNGHEDDGSSRDMRLSERPPTGRPGTATLSSNGTATAQGHEIASTDDFASPSEQQQQQQQQEQQQEQEQQPEMVKRPSTSTIRRSSARPPTARPAAPRVRVVETAPEDDVLSQPTYSTTNVILDGDTNKDGEDDDDDETFVIEEISAAIDPTVTSHIPSEDVVGAPHGSLVARILETKRDLETGSERPTTGHRKVEIDTRQVSDAARRKEREAVAREMGKLREGVQSLSRGANPLGKLVGYHEEDVESMLRELDAWTVEGRQLEAELRSRQSESDSERDRLKREMRQVEESIEEAMAKMSVVKVNIIRNDERIRNMVSVTMDV